MGGDGRFHERKTKIKGMIGTRLLGDLMKKWQNVLAKSLFTNQTLPSQNVDIEDCSKL